MKIVNVEQMRRLELASVSAGISLDTLMENAGLATAKEGRQLLGAVAGTRVLVLVGPGNNGGDGLVAARHLSRWGATVTAYLVVPRPQDDSKLMLATDMGALRVSAAADTSYEALDAALSKSHLVIDAVLGTGRSRPLEGRVKEVMLRLADARTRRSNLVVFALDVPTGMDAETGQVDAACPQADLTITFGYPKLGHFRFPGAGKLGKLASVDIGIPGGLDQDINVELLTSRWVKGKLPTRPLDSHKGTFGHTLVIAGSRSYPGAAYLASQGAGRVGSGLVTLAAPHGIYPTVASKLTEAVHLPLPEDEDGRFHPDGAIIAKEYPRQLTAMVVGCGFSTSPGLEKFIQKLLLEDPKPSVPVVIDADGLNNLSRIEGWWHQMDFPAVLTPHPGEMSSLTGVPAAEIQARRTDTAMEWASVWGKVLVLKGAFTVVASPDKMCWVSPYANPILASGGTGDVLTGMIAGLLAQGLSTEDAACCAVYIHGAAGEVLCQEMGDTGAVASDLLPLVPRVIRRIKEG